MSATVPQPSVTDHVRRENGVWWCGVAPGIHAGLTEQDGTVNTAYREPTMTAGAKPRPTDLLDLHQRDAAKRRYSRRLLWSYGLGIGIPLVLFGLLFAGFAKGANHSPLLLAALGIPVAAILVLLGVNHAVFRYLRHRGVWWAQPSPLLAVEFKDRRRLMRALRRDQPAPDDIAPAVVHASMQWLSRMHIYLMITPGVALILITANTVMQQTRAHNTFLLVYNCVLAVFVVVITVRRNLPIARNARRRLALADSDDTPL